MEINSTKTVKFSNTIKFPTKKQNRKSSRSSLSKSFHKNYLELIHKEQEDITLTLSQKQDLRKKFAKSLIATYKPLSNVEKIFVLEEIERSSSKNLTKYNQIFNKIKEEITEINESLKLSNNFSNQNLHTINVEEIKNNRNDDLYEKNILQHKKHDTHKERKSSNSILKKKNNNATNLKTNQNTNNINIINDNNFHLKGVSQQINLFNFNCNKNEEDYLYNDTFNNIDENKDNINIPISLSDTKLNKFHKFKSFNNGKINSQSNKENKKEDKLNILTINFMEENLRSDSTQMKTETQKKDYHDHIKSMNDEGYKSNNLTNFRYRNQSSAELLNRNQDNKYLNSIYDTFSSKNDDCLTYKDCICIIQ